MCVHWEQYWDFVFVTDTDQISRDLFESFVEAKDFLKWYWYFQKIQWYNDLISQNIGTYEAARVIFQLTDKYSTRGSQPHRTNNSILLHIIVFHLWLISLTKEVCTMCSFQETFSYCDLPRPTLDSLWIGQLNINILTRNNNVTAREL